MVRESQCAAVFADFATAARPRGGRVDGVGAAGEDVIDRLVAGRGRERVAFGELAKEVGGASGGGVEVAAEKERVAAGPGSGDAGGMEDLFGGARRVADRRVKVRDAQSGGGAGERHHPALGAPLVEDVLLALGDVAERGIAAEEDDIGAALVGADQVGVEAGEAGPEPGEGVARGEDEVVVAPGRLGESGAPAGRALLQEGDVPLGGEEDAGEFREKVAVDLDVSVVSLRGAQEAGAKGVEAGIGGLVAAVEEVPGQGGEAHRPSMRSLPRHFLTGEELGGFELGSLLTRAQELKEGRQRRAGSESLRGRSVGMFFEKPSTRTRISFDVGITELGGHPVVLRSDELQLARGESVGDTARVFSRFLSAIVIRAGSHELVEGLAQEMEVPVVNGLTPLHHPCQALADLLTLRQRFDDVSGLRLAYVGDGNNVARSLAIAGEIADVEVVIASPSGYQLEGDAHGARLTDDPRAAADGAHAIYTDVWVSMGDEETADQRRKDLAPYRIDEDLLSAARDDAIVLHCLPAHPGEEITEGVLYGNQSAVWDQAENRLHAQKALLELLLNDD